MHQIRFRLGSAGAPPQTPLGELTVLPRPPSWILRGSTSVETMNTQKWIVWAAESLKISILGLQNEVTEYR